jgi:D-alanyl-D-alanine carboxypeptidase
VVGLRAGDRSRPRLDARLLAGLFVVAACIVAIGSAGASGARPHGGAASARPNIVADIRRLVRMPAGPPGAIVVIQRGRKTIVYRAGVSQVGTRGPLSPNQRMRIASVAKAFSGAVALALVNRRVLSPSDTIGKWLPRLPRAWRRVTLGQALQHTAGLPDFSSSPKLADYVHAHPHATVSPGFLLSFVAHKRLDFTPGTRYDYSNTDNVVVALMAEAATHRSYTTLLRSLVFSRLGLRRTSLPSSARIPSPFMHGYVVDPEHPPSDVTTTLSAAYTWASGGIVSTPADLARFFRGYVGARLFSRATQAKQLRLIRGNSDPAGPGTNSVGLAIFRYRTRCGTVYGHTGSILGYTQFAAATLDGKRSVVVSLNGQLGGAGASRQADLALAAVRQTQEDAVCAALR